MTKRCVLPNQEEISLAQLLQSRDFSHPLFAEPPPAGNNKVFLFTYHNVTELFSAGIFVYSTLLHATEPKNCRFKITPAADYSPSPPPEPVFFSSTSQRAAQQPLAIHTLEVMVQELTAVPFVFSDDVIIDSEFSAEQLPETVNGDSLYLDSVERHALLNLKSNIQKFELRYIHPQIGLGAYARVAIKKGELISTYSGIKKITNSSYSNYLFSLAQDCLHMELDAKAHGNITRFINHAPKSNSDNLEQSSNPLLTANVFADDHVSNGLQWVAYYAERDIEVGEQLLVCYGSNYFKRQIARGFSADGGVLDTNNNILKPNRQKKLKHMRIMANHGIRTAQSYVLGRISLIILAISFAALCLNWLMP